MDRLEHRVFNAFNQIFEDNLDNNISRQTSFEKASDEFKRKCGFSAYKDHESFRNARNRRRKNR